MGVLLLVRHGQASWGAPTTTCSRRSARSSRRLLGAALAARGVRPDLVLRGSMRRHRQTADGAVAGGRLGRRRSPRTPAGTSSTT